MAGERTLPGLGLTGFWNLGSAWKSGMDENLIALSALTQLVVKSRATSLPGSPTNGDIHILTAGGDATKIAIRDNGAWVLIPPHEGWIAHDNDANTFLKFDGTIWNNLLPATAEYPPMAGQAGKVLTVEDDEEGVKWAAAATLPPFAGNANKTLQVNTEGDGVEWVTPATTEEELPPTTGNAGKMLVVNGTGDGVAWADVPEGAVPELPVITGNAGKMLVVNGAEDAVVWSSVPGDDITVSIATETANYVLALVDAGAYLRMNVATANSVTVPPVSSAAFSVGHQITVRSVGAGQTTIVAGAGVTILTPETLVLRKQGSTVLLTMVAADVWELAGDVVLA